MAYSLTSWYINAMEKQSDLRTSGWLLMSSPFPTIAIVVLYLLFVYYGPKWMEKRPAYSFHNVLLVYNAALVLLSAYMFWEFLASSMLTPGFSWICERVDYSNKPEAVRLASACWWYFFSKVIELLDTVFFILRKKNNQVSFLHVYHHASMVLLWWIGVRFVAGGEVLSICPMLFHLCVNAMEFYPKQMSLVHVFCAAYFSAMLNCMIHIFMYTYYLLSGMGPHMRKYLWWKRYMTTLQLMQFFAILLHTSTALYLDCGIPRAYEWALIAYMISHIILFSNFYHKTYVKLDRNKQIDSPSNENSSGKKHN